MPKIKVNDISMYYEIHGSGEPLIFIGGLANPTTDYTKRSKIVEQLAKDFKVITFDNRGVGQTDKPDIPYTIEMMADDTVGLMHELKIKQANVVGVSMGGRIALDIALRYPELVKKLVLVSTGARSIRTLRGLMLVDLLPKISLFRKTFHEPMYAFKRQRQASRKYDQVNKLHQIQTPTLIFHGKNDRIAPPLLAEELQKGIKGSKLIEFNGGHLFLFQRQKEFVETVREFLQ